MDCEASSIFHPFNQILGWGIFKAMFEYLPAAKLVATDHIMVDGAPNPASVLTLSHWRGNNTPTVLKHDLSCGIAFNALRAMKEGSLFVACPYVTNNHFDEDGLVSLFTLTNSEEAIELEDKLMDIASAGDFGVYSDRDMARVSFMLNAWACPELSPLSDDVFALPRPEIEAILYEELLLRLPKIIAKISSFSRFWQEEDDFLSETEKWYEKGLITFEERPGLDLLIVNIDEKVPPRADKERASSWISSVLHPMFIHNKSRMMRVAVLKGRRREVYFRYETWVDYQSRTLLPRLDLSALARQFNLLDRKGRWQFNSTDDIIARLYMQEKDSVLTEDDFLKLLVEALSSEQS